MEDAPIEFCKAPFVGEVNVSVVAIMGEPATLLGAEERDLDSFLTSSFNAC